MKFLFDNQNQVVTKLLKQNLFLFLDYDGTLTSIVRKPELAKLDSQTKAILNQLAKIENCRIAIISGRSLKDIKELIGLKKIIYVGNHGFQAQGPGLKFKPPLPAGYERNLRLLKHGLMKNLLSFDGLCIEDKDICLTVHYRMVPENQVSSVKEIFDKLTAALADNSKIKVTYGKKVFEIRPPVDWHKGKIVTWLLGKYSEHGQFFPVYIGDDLTDEDAFKTIKNTGLSVVVGKTKNSNAQYFVKDITQVAELLEIILNNLRITSEQPVAVRKKQKVLCPG